MEKLYFFWIFFFKNIWFLVDISEYVVQDSMNITTEVTGSLPSEDTSIEAHIALEIGVTSQGACNAAKSAASDTGT